MGRRPLPAIMQSAPRRALVPCVMAILLAMVAAAVVWSGGRHRSLESSSAPSGIAASPPSSAAVTALAAPPSDALDARWFVDDDHRVAFSGRVFVDGRPAGGVAISLRDALDGDDAVLNARTTSREDGRFNFAPQPLYRDAVRIAAVHPGYAAAWLETAGDSDKDGIELFLERCPTRVHGVVSDASGGVVPGARVSLVQAPEQSTSTDQAGAFSLCVHGDAPRLRVTASGYGDWVKTVRGVGNIHQDVELLPEAILDGTVVIAPSRAAAPYALIALRSEGEIVRSVVADAAGHFTMTHLSPGQYLIEGRGNGLKSRFPFGVVVDVASTSKVVLVVDTRVHVDGRLLTVGSASRADAPTGEVVKLGFEATSEWSSLTRVAPDGTFSIDDAPVGNLTIRVGACTVDTPKTVRVPEAGLHGLEVHVRRRAELLVTVTKGGLPVREAAVSIRGPDAVASLRSGWDGTALFRGLTAQALRVSAALDGTFAAANNVQVADNSRSTLSLDLAASGKSIEGRVVDTHGTPVDGASVSFGRSSLPERPLVTVATDAEGRFRGGPLPGPATYRAQVERSGVPLEASGEFPVASVSGSGDVSPREWRLVVNAADRELRGHVVDDAGGPVADARITVRTMSEDTAIARSTFSGQDGAFSLRDLGSGPYRLKVYAPGGRETERAGVTLPSDDVTIVVAPAGAIAGTLQGFSRSPSVMAWSVAGYRYDFRNYAQLDGEDFIVSALPPGKYHVQASAPDGAAHALVDVEPNRTVHLDLVASGKRTIRGRTLDFITGRPLPGLSCVAAPYHQARSPVVVPGGHVFSDAEGNVALEDVPDGDLYMWCYGAGAMRGGAVRMPSDLGDKPFTLWGLDGNGRPEFAATELGYEFDNDDPFSHRVGIVAPKGLAARSGLLVGDTIQSVGARAISDCGNGTVTNYIALMLTEERRVTVSVTRSSGAVTVAMQLE